jgi:bifunctional DNA-binding transcriptional regulator/antitoxin component of YhaV-PrlF toxin-antitoxin module
MNTSVSKRGQTSIPAEILRRHGLQGGDRLAWIDEGETIRVVPLPADPIRALRGSARGQRLGEKLLQERRKDRDQTA